MSAAQIKIDFTEIKETKSRKSVKKLIENRGFRFQELFDFWDHFEKKKNDVTENAIVFSDLHSLVHHIERMDREGWSYRVKKNNPYFISIIRNKRDAKAANAIDTLLKLSDNRITVIETTKHLTSSKDKTELLKELNKVISQNFTPDALKKVSYNKSQNSFIITFNDGGFGEVTLNDLQMEDMTDELLLESPGVSEHGNALEVYTKNGEIVDIDADVLRSIISQEAKEQIKQETKMTGRHIGSRIKSMREQQNITQNKLSELTGIDQAILSKIETGKHLARLDTIERIAKGLKITVTQLLEK